MFSKGEIVQVSHDSANNVFPGKLRDLGKDGRQTLVRHSDSGNCDADTLIFSYCKDEILCSDR